jgi:hypothetical protein
MISPLFFTIFIFAVFVLFNIYIRIRTFGLYKQLVKHRIQFSFNDIFSKPKWDKVILNYPEHEALLLKFRKHMIKTGFLFAIVIHHGTLRMIKNAR